MTSRVLLLLLTLGYDENSCNAGKTTLLWGNGCLGGGGGNWGIYSTWIRTWITGSGSGLIIVFDVITFRWCGLHLINYDVLNRLSEIRNTATQQLYIHTSSPESIMFAESNQSALHFALHSGLRCPAPRSRYYPSIDLYIYWPMSCWKVHCICSLPYGLQEWPTKGWVMPLFCICTLKRTEHATTTFGSPGCLRDLI